MKLGDVLKKEREGRGLSREQAADRMGVSVDRYVQIEAGADAELERVGGMLLGFNELVKGQVNQLFYPCGLPFTQVEDYRVN